MSENLTPSQIQDGTLKTTTLVGQEADSPQPPSSDLASRDDLLLAYDRLSREG